MIIKRGGVGMLQWSNAFTEMNIIKNWFLLLTILDIKVFLT